MLEIAAYSIVILYVGRVHITVMVNSARLMLAEARNHSKFFSEELSTLIREYSFMFCQVCTEQLVEI